MPGLIAGYDYDIFVSYRRKDNKYDGWVTEFVENLKRELESTFKEEISLYFDSNPHDGLLEMHDVGASLEEKLKCLIFIPIISRTYCDPKSFAWEHEFKAFVKSASQDQFGHKVKLPDGNVASRVLPVRIHDLDAADIKQCEIVIGGVLRGIEFVYREPGVNRSLRPEDDENKNLNKTRYRNQINKVALAVKNIIEGLQTSLNETPVKSSPLPEPSRKDGIENKPDRWEAFIKIKKKKLLWLSVLLAIITISAIVVSPKIFRQGRSENFSSSTGKISLAVFPFQNMTNDTIWNIWQDGIQDILITSLSGNEEIKVRGMQPVRGLIQNEGLINYSSLTPAISGKISRKLDANIFISGNIKQAGPIIRINAQLTDSKTEEVIRTFQIEGVFKEERIFRIIDSLSVLVRNYILVENLQKKVSGKLPQYISTTSPEAYRYYVYGINAMSARDLPTASDMLLKAVASDTSFLWAYYMLSYGYYRWGRIAPAKELALYLNNRREQLPLQQKLWVNHLYSLLFGTPHERLTYLTQLAEIDDRSTDIYLHTGFLYNDIRQYEKAISPLEEALKIYDRWGLKPEFVDYYDALLKAYHETGRYKKEKKLFKKAEKDFPDNPVLIVRQVIMLLASGKNTGIEELLEKYISDRKKTYGYDESFIDALVGNIYTEGGHYDKAEEHYRKALLLSPGNYARMNDLAYLLVDRTNDFDEGMALVDKSLEINPDNVSALYIKGLGLHKLGRYEEALEFLEKSWELKPVYRHSIYTQIEETRRALTGKK